MQLKKLSLLLIAITGGCAFFPPEYKQPVVNTPTQTKNGLQFESTTIDLSQVKWWEKFKDPELDNLIIKALKNNNQIKGARHNVLKAKDQLKAAQYAWIPTLNLSGLGVAGNTYLTNLTPEGSLNQLMPSGSVGNTNFSIWEGGFVPSYTFNAFNNINQTKLAKASLELQKANYDALRLSIIGQVSGGYFMLLGEQKQLQLQKEVIADLTGLYNLEESKIQVGRGDSSTLALLKQQLEIAKTQIPQLENSISKTENALYVLLGENWGKLKVKYDLENYNLTGIVPSHLSSKVLQNRPDILIAEDNLKMSNANLGLARSVFFPTINVTGNMGAVSVALSNLFSVGSGFWFLQAAINMPILNASSYEQIKVAKNGYYVAYYNYVQVVKQAFSDVDNSLTNQQKVDETYLLTKNSHLAIVDYYNLTNNKYQVGMQDKTNLLNAKLQLDNSSISLNFAKMQQLSSIVQVYQSLAGGYGVGSSLAKTKS